MSRITSSWGRIAALGAAVLVPAVASAALITPTSIRYINTPNQELTGANLDNETNIINGNGLSGVPTLANYTSITHASVSFSSPGNAWVTTDPGGAASDFLASGGNPPVFDVDLGGTYTLASIVNWGYHFGTPNANSPKTLQLDFSSDGGATFHTSLAGIEVPLTAGAAVTSAFPATTGNFVRMTVTDNHFGPGSNGGDRIGLAEIRFLEVPEPMSVLALGVGLTIGFGMLRRRGL